jgi:hypothetical protein
VNAVHSTGTFRITDPRVDVTLDFVDAVVPEPWSAMFETRLRPGKRKPHCRRTVSYTSYGCARTGVGKPLPRRDEAFRCFINWSLGRANWETRLLLVNAIGAFVQVDGKMCVRRGLWNGDRTPRIGDILRVHGLTEVALEATLDTPPSLDLPGNPVWLLSEPEEMAVPRRLALPGIPLPPPDDWRDHWYPERRYPLTRLMPEVPPSRKRKE